MTRQCIALNTEVSCKSREKTMLMNLNLMIFISMWVGLRSVTSMWDGLGMVYNHRLKYAHAPEPDGYHELDQTKYYQGCHLVHARIGNWLG